MESSTLLEELIMQRAVGQYLREVNVLAAYRLLEKKKKEGHGKLSCSLFVKPFAPYENISVDSILELIYTEKRGLTEFLKASYQVNSKEMFSINWTIDDVLKVAREQRTPASKADAVSIIEQLNRKYSPDTDPIKSQISEMLKAF